MQERDITEMPGRSKSTRPLFAGYPRVSRVGARDDERLRSPEYQAELIRSFASSTGVDVRMYDAELDVSGSRPRRVILDRIIEAIERGELAGVIVAKLNRLSRLGARDRVELFERIERAGGVVLSASEPNDLTTAEGRFTRELFLAIARMEWERYRDGFDVAKEAALDRGVAIKSVAPFGYRFDDDHRLEVVAGEAELVVELFERRAAGEALGALLELFENRTGRSSYRSTMTGILRNRAYLGEVVYGGRTVVDAHPAVVDVELFEAVQAVNAARSSGRGVAVGRAKALLAGIAKCEACGRGLTCSKTGSRRAYSYKCPADARHCQARAFVDAAALDAHVTAAVVEWAGPAGDQLVELEVELGARGDRVVAEHRLAEAEAALVAHEANVELELEVGAAAYAAGRLARRELIARRRAELEAFGAASEVEVVRSTLRSALAGDELTVDEQRRLFRIALAAVVVRRTPRRGAPIVERVAVAFADDAADGPGSSEQDRAELVEQLA
jgi:DNA invertase Pin-like site-specific DNA recombinase